MAKAAISLIKIPWVIQTISDFIFYTILTILHITSTQCRMHQIICVRLELCNPRTPRNEPNLANVAMLCCFWVYLNLSNKLQWNSPYCYLSLLLRTSKMVVLTQHLSRKCQSPWCTNSLYIFNLKEIMITVTTNNVEKLLHKKVYVFPTINRIS